MKKFFLKISQYSQENICAGVSFLIKIQSCNFIKKRLQLKYFPVNIAKFLRTFETNNNHKHKDDRSTSEAYLKP